MKESDIKHERGSYWVGATRSPASYTVYKNGVTHATPDSSYAKNPDGLSIAIARCNYLAKMEARSKSLGESVKVALDATRTEK